jgi:hypothetical protein
MDMKMIIEGKDINSKLLISAKLAKQLANTQTNPLDKANVEAQWCYDWKDHFKYFKSDSLQTLINRASNFLNNVNI